VGGAQRTEQAARATSAIEQQVGPKRQLWPKQMQLQLRLRLARRDMYWQEQQLQQWL
jgi:hypothetical protein